MYAPDLVFQAEYPENDCEMGQQIEISSRYQYKDQK